MSNAGATPVEVAYFLLGKSLSSVSYQGPLLCSMLFPSSQPLSFSNGCHIRWLMILSLTGCFWYLSCAPLWALNVGNRVTANTNVNVRSAPAGSILTTRVTGDKGTIIGGPTVASLNGTPITWWQVNWDTGTDGWSFEGGLDQATLTYGIDVSHYQGTITWSSASTQIDFAITKATEDTSIIDSKLATNMTNGKAVGVLMGVYHFARPDATPSVSADALDEARYFIKNVHPYLDDGILWPVLDLEAGSSLGKSALSAWSRTFCQEVERLTTVKPIIYTSRNYAQNYIETDLTVYPLWIAVPDTTPGETNFDLGPWSAWTLQQYSWTGTVPGIAGDVDLNAFLGDTSDLQAYVLPPLTHTITNASASPALAVRGRSVSLTGNITSSKSRQLLLGASIFPTGATTGGTSNSANDGIVTLTQGNGTATRSFALPSTLAAGNYDLWLALYLDLNNSGTIDTGDIAVGSTFKKTNTLQVFTSETYDTWAAAAGLAAGAFAADLDGDGQNNLTEYAFGSLPNQPNAAPLGVTIAGSQTALPNSIRVTFPRPVRGDLTYRIQRSANLQSWTTVFTATNGAVFTGANVSQTSGGTPVVTAYITPLVGTPTFVRVEVVSN
jgi:GH25 family lysozyme M1 (1,4-beta-N-acetylmuramidase)